MLLFVAAIVESIAPLVYAFDSPSDMDTLCAGFYVSLFCGFGSLIGAIIIYQVELRNYLKFKERISHHGPHLHSHPHSHSEAAVHVAEEDRVPVVTAESTASKSYSTF